MFFFPPLAKLLLHGPVLPTGPIFAEEIWLQTFDWKSVIFADFLSRGQVGTGIN